MNKLNDIFTGRNTFAASLLLTAIILLFLAPRAAVNVDEQLHYPHAQKVINWYFTGGADKTCLDTPVTNLKYYGQSVDNLTALVNRVFQIDKEFLTRHFTGAVFFWVLLLFAGLTGKQLTGSYYVSALIVVFMLATPRLFGQAFGNLKDIPFAAGYLAAIFFIIKYVQQLPESRWMTAVWLGLAIAFTNSVRIGGLVLFGYLAFAILLMILLKPFLLKQIFSTKSNFVRLSGQMLTVVLTGYFAGLVFWPFALQNVFVNPFESLRVMEHYKVSIRQVFEGEWLWSTQLPWYYLPKWLLIATPGFLLTGFAVFSGLFFYQLKTNRKQLFTELFLFFTLLFPVVYVIVIGANLYSGYRQMLFVIPVLAILAALGFYKLFTLLKNRFWVAGIQVALLIVVLIPVKHQVQTFPVDYVYFNQLSGGNQNAWSEYEYDYYFHGVKKAAEDLIAQTGGNPVIVASNCNLSNYFEELPNTSFRFVRFLERSSEDWDYGIFGVNYIHPRLLKSGKWKSTQIVKTYSHYGNPIVVLMKRTDKSDFEGTKLTDSGNYPEATELLEKALKADENNVWLISYLAKISLKQNDFESFNRYLQQGRMVYPEYEPFFLLEAQQLFNSGKFNEAESVLDKVLTINPHYNVAASLLNEVKKNLNDNKLQ